MEATLLETINFWGAVETKKTSTCVICFTHIFVKDLNSLPCPQYVNVCDILTWIYNLFYIMQIE